uniref:Pre-mRNA-splicing factor SLU7 n=1 Tax=Wuchereria bancrofti TaxID=6293 RepID=A0A1I8EQP7_WUCBA
MKSLSKDLEEEQKLGIAPATVDVNAPGKEKEAVKFAGENFIHYTGEVVQANEAQVFAWQASCKGIDVHALGEPTKLEAMKKSLSNKIKCERRAQKQFIRKV